MESSILKKAAKFLQEHKNNHRWQAIFLTLAAVVALGTVGVLTLTGHAMTPKVRELTCTVADHTHTNDCYGGDGKLTCTKPELILHTHNDDCYDDKGVLICQLEERVPHTHTDACYKETRTLTCGQEESSHIHTDECYTVVGKPELKCGLEEHTHGPECYDEENNLICELTDHTHTDDCYTQPEKVLTCGIEEGAGHQHSDECYTVERTLTCSKPEYEEHQHTDNCYEKDESGRYTLICGKPTAEEHTHSMDAGCITVRELTPEEAEELEKSGHIGTETNNDPQGTPQDNNLTVPSDSGTTNKPQGDTWNNDPGPSIEEPGIVDEQQPSAPSGSPEDPSVEEPGTGEETQTGASAPERTLICGKEEHNHDDSCINENGEIACGLEEHTHTEECYAVEPVTEPELICEKEEHQHDENCKDENGEIVCNTEEHMHSAECYSNINDEERGQLNEVLGQMNILPGRTELESKLAGFGENIEERDAFWDDLVRRAAEIKRVYDIFSENSRRIIEANRKYEIMMSLAASAPATIETTGVEKDSLNDCFVDMTVEDADKKPIESGNTLYVEKEYTLTFTFSEREGERQFKQEMEFDIPPSFNVSDIGEQTATMKVNGTEYTYTYWIENGKIHVKFPDAVKGANNVNFSIVLNAILANAGEDGKVDIPVKDGTDITFNVESRPVPTVEKTAGEYDPVTQTVTYTVEVSAEHGDIHDVKLKDHLSSGENSTLYYEDPLELTVWREKNGEKIGEETKRPVKPDDTNNFETELGDLENGEKYVVQYQAHVREDIIGENGYVDATQRNTVTVTTGDTGKDKFTKEAKAQITSTLFTKVGNQTTIETENGGKEDVLRWKVQIGDGYSTSGEAFLGQTLTDTLGENLTFCQHDQIRVRVYDAESGDYEYYKVSWEDINPNGNVMQYTFPATPEELLKLLKGHNNSYDRLPDKYYFVVVYYTHYTIPNGKKGDTFENVVTTKINGKPETARGEEWIGPFGVSKEIVDVSENEDQQYIEYKVTVDSIAPMENHHTPFRFDDELILVGPDGTTYYPRNDPQELKVSLSQGGESSVQLSPYDDTVDRTQGNGYILRCRRTEASEGSTSTEINRFLLVFNTSNMHAWETGDSYLYITEASDLTVEYKINLDSPVYENGNEADTEVRTDKTIRDLLAEGYTLKNTAKPSVNGQSNTDTVDYRNPKYEQNVVKTGRVLEDGTLEYSVEFKNWYKKDDGTDDYRHYIFEDVNELEFIDDFDDEYFQYKRGSLYVKLLDCDSETFEAAYQYTGENPIDTDGNIHVWGNEFTVRNDDMAGLGKGDIETKYPNGNYNSTLNDAILSLQKDGRESKRIVFVYKLEKKTDINFPATSGSHYSVKNTAEVKGGSYEGSDDFTVDYDTGMMDKTGKQKDEGSDIIEFTIELNPTGADLITKEGVSSKSLTLTDEMSDNLILQVSTIRILVVKDPDKAKPADPDDMENYEDFSLKEGVVPVWNEEQHTLTIQGLPDGKYIRILYDAKVTTHGDDVKISNKASIDGSISVDSQFDKVLNVQETSSSGEGSTHCLTLTKLDSSKNSSGADLQGAEFLLYEIAQSDPKEDNEDRLQEAVNGKYEDMFEFEGVGTGYYIGRYTVGLQGNVLIDNQHFADEICYVLVEVKAPEGYVLPQNNHDWTVFYYGKEAAKNPLKIDVVSVDGAINIPNTPDGYELPETGGGGFTKYIVGGLVLAMAAASLIYIEYIRVERRRRRARSSRRRREM